MHLAYQPPEAKERTLCAADRIIEGEFVLFGRTLAATDVGLWDAYIDKPGHWSRDKWWKLDIRSGSRAADVKWTWELGRQRHLVVLARAAYLQPSKPVYRAALVQGLRSFLEQAPPEMGIHWYSNLEIALRIMRWQEILGLVDVGTKLRRAMSAVIGHARRHLVADLGYTLSTMRNNHLLGDALGILVARPSSRRDGATLVAERLFALQLRCELRPDGSMTEDSVSYHRFVLEMLAWRLRVANPDPSLAGAAVSAAQYLARLGAFEGQIPQFGDWDEGRVLCVADDPSSLSGSVAATLSLAGTGSPPDWRQRWDECTWYTSAGEPIEPEPAVTDGSDVGGGTGRASCAGFTVWLKAGSGPWHGHADLCSCPIRAQGEWLIGDPGTGTYNGDPEIRDHFRSTAAHSALALDGLDQLGPHRTFRWRNVATGTLGAPLRGTGWTLMWGGHDAYRRLAPARRVARTVLVSADVVVVADWVEGPLGLPWSLALPLGPEVRYDSNTTSLHLGRRRYPLLVPARPAMMAGAIGPFRGWWSDTYGSWRPSTLLTVSGHYNGPVLWAVGDTESVHRVGHEIRARGVRWSVSWQAPGPTLYVSSGRTADHLDLPLAP
ncbi:MAG: heparinase II/III-family protein [Actinomycetota bacterium]|nr:heparinase II/III-family protein [Actinomycetota bacterium]